MIINSNIFKEKFSLRELRSLESINDNYEKIILTLDKLIVNDYNGIKIINKLIGY